jgi:catechol 2,3-dioxygenase-like lactoylglutathione lyase family enzyme
MQPTLTHIAKQVADIEATVKFYTEFCKMKVVHKRTDENEAQRVVWLAEEGKEESFVFVIIAGDAPARQSKHDYSHLGFALASRQAVDHIADLATAAKCLAWKTREEPYPVGYYCGVYDPDGHVVEFSYGQPLGDSDEGNQP